MWIVAIVAALYVALLIFSSRKARRALRHLIEDRAGGIGNRFAYGNLSISRLQALLAGLGVFTPASWSEPAWFIDPANSTGLASDSNAGTTAAAPLKTYAALVAKWGTTSPTLRQDTTITFMSSQPVGGADPVLLNPYCGPRTAAGLGCVVTVQGTPTVVHSGALAGVVSKNRATATQLQADLGVAGLATGTLVKNTAGGKVSFAMVYKFVAGTTYKLTQPIAPIALPMGETPVVTEVDTWANGDTFEVSTLPQIFCVQSQPIIVCLDSARGFPAPVQFTEIAFGSPDGVNSDGATLLDNTSLLNVFIDSTVLGQFTTGGDLFTNYIGVICAGSVVTNNEQVQFCGGAVLSPIVGSVIAWNGIDFDAILDCSAAGITLGSPIFSQGVSPTFMGQVQIDGGTLVIAEQDVSVHGNLSGANIIWGSGSLDVAACGRLIYGAGAGAAVATFLQTGGLKINGQNNASTYNNGTGAWTANIALTAAHLDDPVNFNGLALRPGGGTITNLVQP